MRPICIRGQYFFEKSSLQHYIQCNALGLGPSRFVECCEIEKFLFYTNFEDFCGLPSNDNDEFIPRLEAIAKCLGLSSKFPFYLNYYSSFVKLSIDGLNVNRAPDDGLSVEPFGFSQLPGSDATITFSLSYNVVRAIPQKLVPSLEFYSKNKLVYSYSTVENSTVDLSQIGKKSISFKVPARDIFVQGVGYYLIKFDTYEFAKVVFPRCKLGIADRNISSFSELSDFCENLDGSPSKKLISFYELLKCGAITQWLQDNKEEREYKEKISKCIEEIRKDHSRFKINDINPILEIISNRTITFPMSEYVTVDISEMKSQNIIGRLGNNYFIPWNSTTSGKLTAIIQPKKNCIGLDLDLDIDFTFKFQVDSIDLTEIRLNLRDIAQRKEFVYDSDFQICVPSSQTMGMANIYVVDSQGFKKETNTYIVVTGEKIQIPLSKDSAITMIGVYSLDSLPFYIAQTPLTLRQVVLLINIAKKNNIDCWSLEESIKLAVKNHNGRVDIDLPCSCMRGVAAREINEILGVLATDYSFSEPTVRDLEIALCDGVEKKEPLRSTEKYDTLRPVSKPIHSTKLGVLDLLGNILSRTKSPASFLGPLLAFGTTYKDPQNTNYKSSISNVDESLIGYRPMMTSPTTAEKENHIKIEKKETIQTSDYERSSDGEFDYLNYYLTYDTYL